MNAVGVTGEYLHTRMVISLSIGTRASAYGVMPRVHPQHSTRESDEMHGPDTESLGQSKMAVETVAHLAAAAAFLTTAPYTPVNYSPAEMAIHVVNDAMKHGRLGLLHTALTMHLR